MKMPKRYGCESGVSKMPPASAWRVAQGSRATAHSTASFRSMENQSFHSTIDCSTKERRSSELTSLNLPPRNGYVLRKHVDPHPNVILEA